MRTDCPQNGCTELQELRRDFDSYCDSTDRRLALGDVTLATINTKLNWLIGILGTIGAAVLTVILKLVSGA